MSEELRTSVPTVDLLRIEDLIEEALRPHVEFNKDFNVMSKEASAKTQQILEFLKFKLSNFTTGIRNREDLMQQAGYNIKTWAHDWQPGNFS